MPVLGVIPARLGSTRLPRKPLQLLAGEPLVNRVAERVREHAVVDRVVVATDAREIAVVVERLGVEVVMTHDRHQTGTERVAEVAARQEFRGYDVIVNIQGDEPFVTREAISGSLDRVRAGDDIGTAAAPLDAELADDPARVKVVTDRRGRALYFSRAVIPFRRDPADPARASTGSISGVYAYSRAALARWVALAPSPRGAGREARAAPRTAGTA